MTLTREDPELARPIEDHAQLVDYFRAGEKPRERWRIGTEHEKIGLRAGTLEPVPYEGPHGIHALLEDLKRDHGFAPLEDAGRLVGLERDGASITLEPGGQLELSGAPLRTLHETCREFGEHITLLNHVSKPHDIVWLGVGMHPLAKVEALPRMPRERHEIMRDYLGRRDDLGLHMMHATAGVQANFDFADEADAATKLRMAMAVSPIATALWANSSVSEGEPNGFESRRAWVWRHTDPDRCGILPFVFDDDFVAGNAYARYTEWALDVPMFLIQRDGGDIPMTQLTFREYLERGHEGQRATLADWQVHLTTLFPEVRIKRILEVRGADAVPPGLVCALPAFWKGLLYDAESLARAAERVGGWSAQQVDSMHADVARNGLEAETPDGPILAVAREFTELSEQGLGRIADLDRSGEDERHFLEPVQEILERGTSPGRDLLERWDGAWQRRIDLLVEYASY